MEKYILSIYIPTFNRAEYLGGLLENIYNEIPYDEKGSVEVVISDNASSDNTKNVAEMLCQKYTKKGCHFKYHRNPENIGSCRNFLQCTDYLEGEWCWLVGDDDMILKGGISTILKILRSYAREGRTLNYCCLNYAYVTMEEREKYMKDTNAQAEIDKEQYFFQDNRCMLLPGYSELFLLKSRIPAHIGTFLGGNLFRSSVWASMRDNVRYTKQTLIGRNEHEEYRLSADYVFPHLIIASKTGMNEQIGYIGVPCMGLGVGAQENASHNWRFIDTVVFDDLFNRYCEYGMSSKAQAVFVKSFGADCGKNLGQLLAGGENAQISKETVAEYIVKYGSNKEFAINFVDGVWYFLEPPIKARYNAYAFELLTAMLQPYTEQNKRIAIWGTGEMAQSLAAYCTGLRENVAMLIDGSKLCWGKSMEEFPGLIVQPPESLKTEDVDMIFISSIKYAEEIIEQIRALDIHADIISCRGKETL